MNQDAPRPVADLDDQIGAALREYHRARWIATVGVMILLCAAVIVLGTLYLQQNARLQASCGFWRALAPLPVTVMPSTGRPTKLGVLIVTGSRTAFAGQGCGPLPPADPSVIHWGKFYGIRVP